jgi:tRNA (guanine-N1)-methyltransferase
MIFDVITLFPEMFDALTQYGITRRAAEQGHYELKTWNQRDFTSDNYRSGKRRQVCKAVVWCICRRKADRSVKAWSRNW